jgi:DNA-binding response OmpR family regulator
MTNKESILFTEASSLLKVAANLSPVAVFIDVHLGEGKVGIEYIPILRRIWPYTPIIVVTEDHTSKLIGDALTSGANDFVRKPLLDSELTDRLDARLSEMQQHQQNKIIRFYGLIINAPQAMITYNDKTEYLPRLEIKLLKTLIDQNGKIVRRTTLHRALWGSLRVSNNALDRKVSNVRRALRDLDANIAIESIYRKGYLVKLADVR